MLDRHGDLIMVGDHVQLASGWLAPRIEGVRVVDQDVVLGSAATSAATVSSN